MGVTISDVAKRAGVSLGTVSSVINGTKYVSPALRKRVEEAIIALDYHPNRSAQSLSSKRSYALAYAIPDVANPVFAKTLRAATRVARQRGYTIIVLDTEGSCDLALQCINQMIRLRVDGAILSLTWDLIQPEVQQKLSKHNITVVGLCGSRPIPGIDCFIWDEPAAGYSIAQYLISLGHKQIAFLGPPHSETANLRLAGVKKAFAEADLAFLSSGFLESAGYTTESAYQTTIEAIEAGLPFTALICFNAAFTTGALAALNDKGLRVPDDVSLVTFGSAHIKYTRPTITSMVMDEDELSRRATLRLIDRIEGKYDQEPSHEYTPLSLSIQGSCKQIS